MARWETWVVCSSSFLSISDVLESSITATKMKDMRYTYDSVCAMWCICTYSSQSTFGNQTEWSSFKTISLLNYWLLPKIVANGQVHFFFFLKKESLSCVPLFATPWSLPDSSVHGISQVRILKWVVISFSRGSSRPRDGTWVSCIAGRFFTIWATREDLFIRGECLWNTYSVPNLKLTIWYILFLTKALSKQVSRS